MEERFSHKDVSEVLMTFTTVEVCQDIIAVWEHVTLIFASTA